MVPLPLCIERTRDRLSRSVPESCVCSALFLRLQFELKKAVDTRTIGCAVAAAAARFSRLLLSPPTFFQAHLPLPRSFALFFPPTFGQADFGRDVNNNNDDNDARTQQRPAGGAAEGVAARWFLPSIFLPIDVE